MIEQLVARGARRREEDGRDAVGGETQRLR